MTCFWKTETPLCVCFKKVFVMSGEVPGVDLAFMLCNFVFPYLWDASPHLSRYSLMYGTVGMHLHFVEQGNVECQV